MAKSRIIKELANSEVDTITALKRAKVLMLELNNSKVLDWINNEIEGYPEDALLPEYRHTRGVLIGSYIKGSMAAHMKWTNVSISLGKMPDEIQEIVLKVDFRDGVQALTKLSKGISEEKYPLAKTIPADFYQAIAKYNNDPYMMITSARVVVETQFLDNVFSVIENKLLDILVLLEKEFGCLDDLDLDMKSKDEKEIDKINERLIFLIYNDNSITIGNSNKIKGSTIASSVDK